MLGFVLCPDNPKELCVCVCVCVEGTFKCLSQNKIRVVYSTCVYVCICGGGRMGGVHKHCKREIGYTDENFTIINYTFSMQ